MSYPTYLEYTIVPNPVTTGATDQELLILATLKTTQENDGQKVDKFVLDHIKINFGTKGTRGSQLSDTEIGTDDFDSPHWTAANDSNSQDPGMIVKLTPDSGYHQVKTNAVQIKINNVQVNDSPGNATLTITEVGTAYENGQPVNGPAQTTGEASLTVLKVPSENASKVIFGTKKPNISAGDSVTLNWTGGEANGTYILHYLLNDQLVKVTGHAPPNGGNFTSPDEYPKKGTGDSELILTETTTFILEITQGSGNPSYLTTTVIVENGDIYVKDATITNDLTVKNLLKANQAVINDVSPWLDFNVGGRAYFESGEITAYDTFEFKRHNSEGDRTLMGSLDKSKLKIYGNIEATGYISGSNLEATAEGSTVTGDLTVDGSIYAPLASHMTDVNTWRDCFGFGHKCATWLSGQQASTGGETIKDIEGFSVTNGNWNYGVYEMNIGVKRSGYVKVDMYMANYGSSSGSGIWNIYSTDHQIKSLDGKYGYDLQSSYMLWSSELSPAYAPTKKGGGRVVRSKVCVYFEGQYIYIGCQDTGGGQVGLKINSVEVIHAVGLS